MKKMLFIFSTVLCSFSSFAQTNTVPEELVTNDSTYWTISTVSSVNYVNTTPGAYNGTTTNGGGMLIKFKFLPGNRFKFQLYVEANSYGTRSTAWTETEGSVTFSKDAKGQDIFITKAEKGVYKTNKNGRLSSRPIPKNELEGQHSCTYLWQKTTFKDDATNIYLLMVDLELHPGADINVAGSIDPSWVSKFHIPAAK